MKPDGTLASAPTHIMQWTAVLGVRGESRVPAEGLRAPPHLLIPGSPSDLTVSRVYFGLNVSLSYKICLTLC